MTNDWQPEEGKNFVFFHTVIVNIRLLSTSRATFSGIVAKLGLVCKVTCAQAFCPLKSILHFYRAACPCYLSSVNFLHQQSPSQTSTKPSSQQSIPFDSQTPKLRFSGRTPLFSRTQYHLFLFTKHKPFCFPSSNRQAKLNRQVPTKEKHVHQRH